MTFGEIEIQQQEEALFHMEYKIILSQNSFFVVYLCRLASLTLSLSLPLSLCYTIIFSSFCCCCKDSFILCGCYSYSQVVVFSFSVYPISHYCYFCLSFCFIVFFILMLRQFIYFYISSFVVVEKEIYSFC